MALVHVLVMALVLTVATSGPLSAAERHPMPPRVPADKLAEARALKNPLPDSSEVVEQGKALYQGKGGCVNCHGTTGRGDGPASANLNPAPRNFHHRGFWRHRTDGEIFWVIKHGSPRTSMIPLGALLSDEEIWAVIQYERSFAEGRGPGHGIGRRGRMGGVGRNEPGCCDRPQSAR
ncbi:MAG: c-type cytochrome [Anaerolineales bacterium]